MKKPRENNSLGFSGPSATFAVGETILELAAITVEPPKVRQAHFGGAPDHPAPLALARSRTQAQPLQRK